MAKKKAGDELKPGKRPRKKKVAQAQLDDSGNIADPTTVLDNDDPGDDLR